MSEVTNIKGLADLQKLLDELAPNLERNVMVSAFRTGSKVLRDQARLLAPMGVPSFTNLARYGGRMGLLRDSISARTGVKWGTVTARITVGGQAKGGGDAYYASWVEYGTKPHRIKVRARGDSSALGLDGEFPFANVKHPGAKPSPFMRPALDQASSAAVLAVAGKIRELLATKHGLYAQAIAEPE